MNSPEFLDDTDPGKTIKKACDLCYKRKVKCEGTGPTCDQCLRAKKPCTYTRFENPTKKKNDIFGDKPLLTPSGSVSPKLRTALFRHLESMFESQDSHLAEIPFGFLSKEAENSTFLLHAMCAYTALFVPQEHLEQHDRRQLANMFYEQAANTVPAALDVHSIAIVHGLIFLYTFCRSLGKLSAMKNYKAALMGLARNMKLHEFSSAGIGLDKQQEVLIRVNTWWRVYVIDQVSCCLMDWTYKSTHACSMPLPFQLEQFTAPKVDFVSDDISFEVGLMSTHGRFIPTPRECASTPGFIALLKILAIICEHLEDVKKLGFAMNSEMEHAELSLAASLRWWRKSCAQYEYSLENKVSGIAFSMVYNTAVLKLYSEKMIIYQNSFDKLSLSQGLKQCQDAAAQIMLIASQTPFESTDPLMLIYPLYHALRFFSILINYFPTESIAADVRVSFDVGLQLLNKMCQFSTETEYIYSKASKLIV
ncbi:hypothetical protein EDD86DRAFT_268527 [Gorgonomyces haynaldii]|nr:hypothetical protein EDD86DRAFT_268527 [Gorgonomyces haynaldii]